MADFPGMDLRNEDIDTVLFLWPDCPDACATTDVYYNYHCQSTTLIIAKNKYGEMKDITLTYNGTCYQFPENGEGIPVESTKSYNTIKDKIINVVDSSYMRNFLQKNCENISVTEYASIIAGAPMPLERKLEMFSNLVIVPMPSYEYEFVSACKKILQDAMEMLIGADGEQSVICMSRKNRPGRYRSNTEKVQVLTYQNMLRYFRKLYKGLNPNDFKSALSFADFYYTMDLYYFSEDNMKKHIYQYIIHPSGEIQYFKDMRNLPKLNTKQRPLPYNIFSGENFKEDLWITPYQPGDLLYINCRPYRRPEFCLVYYVSKNASMDSESLTSVYPSFGGLIAKRTINGDRVFVLEREYFRDSYISPFYRAEVYRSELPESCKFMEPVIKALKKKPELGEYIDIFVGYGKEYQIDSKEDIKMFGISEKQWNIIVDFCNKNVDYDSDVTI